MANQSHTGQTAPEAKSGRATYSLRPGEGRLFPAHAKVNQPNLRGTINVAGSLYDASGWINQQKKKHQEYIELRLKREDEGPHGHTANRRRLKYSIRPNEGKLFYTKHKANQPHLRGTINVGGEFYDVSGWINPMKLHPEQHYIELRMKPQKTIEPDHTLSNLLGKESPSSVTIQDEMPFLPPTPSPEDTPAREYPSGPSWDNNTDTDEGDPPF